ncbi:MAG: class I SAM-dependent methyltransferase [Candidatus Limnocylindrales bacterium]
MTDQSERYDRMAAGYDQHWAPVLRPSATALLERLEGQVRSGARELLDVGVGTGNLTIAALARWPDVRVTGVDPSREMINAVDALVRERLPAAIDRFAGRVAYAAEMPFDDGAFDVAMSSFVLQLVPKRAVALREIRRVLRPGGTLVFVTWLKDARLFEPDRVFDTLLDEFGFEEEPDEPRSGDIPTVERAAAELRRAGFRDVAASRESLDHAFTVDGYIAFLTEFDEESLFEEMDRTERRRFLRTFRERLMALDPVRFRVPIVYASGRRP